MGGVSYVPIDATDPSSPFAQIATNTEATATNTAQTAANTAYAGYSTNDVDDAEPLYVGKENSAGAWVVLRYDSVAGQLRYAAQSNNSGVTTYAAAWSGRTGLTYAVFSGIAI